MTFTTLTFVLFLAVIFTVYWSAKRCEWQNAVIALASYAFYGWWDYRFCALMLASSLVDFFVGLGLGRARRGGSRRGLLLVSLAANLGMLGFFKYFNFFADQFEVLANALGWRVDPITLRVLLPVGISFYTFQTMSYTIDVYRGQLKPTGRIIAYLAYVSSFMQLVAGPIERGPHLLPQFLNPRRFDYDKAVDGCRQVLWGFFKKLVVADQLAVVADMAYGDVGASSGPMLAFATVCFAFQIYCDFSAYSDIAIGTGRLFGFDLMRNFAYPYFSPSMGVFWRRWHISLSTWFRDYVYVPLGGSRVRPMRHAFNIMLTFVISGLWHGASWNFIVWGAIMGAGLLPEALGVTKGSGQRAGDVPAGGIAPIVRTFAYVCLGWVFFRAATLSDALLALQKMVVEVIDPAAWAAVGELLDEKEGRAAPLLIGIILAIEWAMRRHAHPCSIGHLPRWKRWVVYSVLFWVTIIFGSQGQMQFIYFRF